MHDQILLQLFQINQSMLAIPFSYYNYILEVLNNFSKVLKVNGGLLFHVYTVFSPLSTD